MFVIRSGAHYDAQMNRAPNDSSAPLGIVDPLLAAPLKGWPHLQAPLLASQVGEQGWNVLAGDLPLPIALLKRGALQHNIQWLAERAKGWGVQLAPHGKTTLSPQLFARQIAAGAWGITVGNVFQLAVAVAVAAGVRHVLIANQVMDAADLAGVVALRQKHADLRVLFLVDSLAQVERIEVWSRQRRQLSQSQSESESSSPSELASRSQPPSNSQLQASAPAFEVLLEVGFAGGRTGCRDEAQALALARRIHASHALSLVGIECYEGLRAQGDDAKDREWVATIMDRVQSVAAQCLKDGLIAGDELILSAGGSAVFDLVAARLTPKLGRPVRGLLRSGCYVTHDHGGYAHTQQAMAARMGCDGGDLLRPALQVWALVQSCPEPGLAILGVGKRDLSFDMGLPLPIARAGAAQLHADAVPAGWRIDALNDQHAYLRWDASDAALNAQAPCVGERIGLGISHPCTTFDKWRWMPVVDENYRVCDAITTHF